MSVHMGVGENMMRKIDAVEQIAKPLGKELGDLAKSSTAKLSGDEISAMAQAALPENFQSIAKSDQGLIQKFIEEAKDVSTPLEAHQFRQRLAKEVNSFGAKNYPNGLPDDLVVATDSIRDTVGGAIDSVEPRYGELRRQLQPLLNARDDFWKQIGSQWKGYEGESANLRASQMARRFIANTNPDLWRSIEKLDAELAKNGQQVGGDIVRQSGTARMIENLWSAARPGTLQADFAQGSLNAMDLANLNSPTGAANVALKVGKSLLAPSAKKAQERAMMETRDALTDFINAVARSKAR
jgi:hypothetical protein